MNVQREYLDYIKDILDAIEKATQFIEGMELEQFAQDAKTVFAVIRALEIIGEATKNVPPSVRGKYATVPWREMAGMRDKLIHEYFGVNVAVVWKTMMEDMPPLKSKIERILAEARE